MAVTATAQAISASGTPPASASSGSATAPIVPPSGTASWRQPITTPRRSGGKARMSDAMPATGTAEPPIPATSSAPAIGERVRERRRRQRAEAVHDPADYEHPAGAQAVDQHPGRDERDRRSQAHRGEHRAEPGHADVEPVADLEGDRRQAERDQRVRRLRRDREGQDGALLADALSLERSTGDCPRFERGQSPEGVRRLLRGDAVAQAAAEVHAAGDADGLVDAAAQAAARSWAARGRP